MTILKIQSKVLDKALQDREMFSLRMYLDSYQRTKDGCFVCRLVDDSGEPTPEIKLSLFDYTFNESESEKLWDIAEETIGKRTIDLKIINMVKL